MDSAVADAAERIFRDLADPQTLNAAGDDSWRAPLWNAVEESGLTRALLPEDAGGAALAFAEAMELARLAGAWALPVPLVETMLAGWLLGRAGIEMPDGPITLAPTRRKDSGDKAKAVPFARDCGHVAWLRGGSVGLFRTTDLAITPGESQARDARDDLVLNGAAPIAEAKAPCDLETLILLGAVARSAQMAGALQALTDISVRYAEERVAFGRPIGKFQAVQHNLAQLASEAAAAQAISASAAASLDASGGQVTDGVWLDAAAAKVRVGEAAGAGAAIAHQVHGAIGFTAEHVLYRYTHRLWGWRDDFDAESLWADRLGAKVCAAGADALWPTLTAA
jgi:alkylation response protein AidB-like acyl-CoA dehydrogenase